MARTDEKSQQLSADSGRGARTRRTAIRVAGIGAVGAAGALLAAPVAQAAAPAPAVGGTVTTTPTPSSGSTSPSANVTIQPDYGFQKARVGIRVAPGAVVPAGTSLAGATLHVKMSDGTNLAEATCTTLADGFCDSGFQNQARQAAAAHVSAAQVQAARAQAAAQPAAANVPPNEEILVFPGASLTVTQLTAPKNLLIDARTLVLSPCIAANGPICDPMETDLVFNDRGLPPVAKNDTATSTDSGTITIKVVTNDSGTGAPITLKSVGAAKHGTTSIRNGAIVYVPDPKFSGTDTFSYTISTANGTSTALVSVKVTAPPVAAVSDAPQLANTGSSSTQPVQVGLGAVAAGLALTFAARRRSAARR
ncbi:hypothetical protein BH10ACT8_BH10ACT8_18570 [soil metagenome]